MTKTKFLDALRRLNAQYNFGLDGLFMPEARMTVPEIANAFVHHLWMHNISSWHNDDTRALLTYLTKLREVGFYKFDAEEDA